VTCRLLRAPLKIGLATHHLYQLFTSRTLPTRLVCFVGLQLPIATRRELLWVFLKAFDPICGGAASIAVNIHIHDIARTCSPSGQPYRTCSREILRLPRRRSRHDSRFLPSLRRALHRVSRISEDRLNATGLARQHRTMPSSRIFSRACTAPSPARSPCAPPRAVQSWRKATYSGLRSRGRDRLPFCTGRAGAAITNCFPCPHEPLQRTCRRLLLLLTALAHPSLAL
jgi:hypothetical protein